MSCGSLVVSKAVKSMVYYCLGTNILSWKMPKIKREINIFCALLVIVLSHQRFQCQTSTMKACSSPSVTMLTWTDRATFDHLYTTTGAQNAITIPMDQLRRHCPNKLRNDLRVRKIIHCPGAAELSVLKLEAFQSDSESANYQTTMFWFEVNFSIFHLYR